MKNIIDANILEENNRMTNEFYSTFNLLKDQEKFYFLINLKTIVEIECNKLIEKDEEKYKALMK